MKIRGLGGRLATATGISLCLLLSFTKPVAHAASLAYTKVNFTQSTEIWGLSFHRDGNSLYFAQNGNTGMQQILTSNLTSSGSAIPSASDGFATFRAANTGWQNTTVIASPTVGLNGRSWIFSGSGNVNKPASPADSAGTTVSGVVWAIDTSDNSVSYINMKRSDGKWQNGQMYWLTITPDGRYLYAMAWASGSAPSGGIEVFKVDLATNTLVGRGVNNSAFPWGPMAADNNGVYFLTSTGILKIGINGDSGTLTGDSAPAMMTLTGSVTGFDFTIGKSVVYINGMLYVGATNNTMAIINPTTGVGTKLNLTNTYNSGSFRGLRLGADSCLYGLSDADKSINQINPNTGEVLASTGAITNMNPYSELGFSMSPNKAIYAVTPRGAVNNGFYVFPISGTTCALSTSAEFNSLALANSANTAPYRTAIVITANVTMASKVTFKSNGVRISGCIGVRTTGSGTSHSATCSWRPARKGAALLSAVATPIDNSMTAGSSTLLNVTVGTRTAPRA